MSQYKEYQAFLDRPIHADKETVLREELLTHIDPTIYTFGGHWLPTPRELPKSLQISAMDAVNNYGFGADISSSSKQSEVNIAQNRLFDWMFGNRMRVHMPYEARTLLDTYASKKRDNPSEWEFLDHIVSPDKGSFVEVLKDTAMLVDTVANGSEGSMPYSLRADAFSDSQIQLLEYTLKKRAILPTQFVRALTELANGRRMLDVGVAYSLSLSAHIASHGNTPELEQALTDFQAIIQRFHAGEPLSKIEYPEIEMEFEDVDAEVEELVITQELSDVDYAYDGRKRFAPRFERHDSPDADFDKSRKLIMNPTHMQLYAILYNEDKLFATLPSAVNAYFQSLDESVHTTEEVVMNMGALMKPRVFDNLPSLAVALEQFAERIEQMEKAQPSGYSEHLTTAMQLRKTLEIIHVILYSTNSAHYPMYADMIPRLNIKELTKKILHTL
jgi:hypothetical protein